PPRLPYPPLCRSQPPAAPADLVPLLVALDRLVALLARRGMAGQGGRRLARDVGRAGALGRLPALSGREGAPVLPARTLDRRSAAPVDGELQRVGGDFVVGRHRIRPPRLRAPATAGASSGR